MKKLTFLLLIPIFITLTIASGTSDIKKVVRVIDGDTFKLENGETVRMIGVDTPETVHPQKTVEYFGKEASDFTKNLLEGKTVKLEYDQQRYDKYNRILAYVFIDDLFVNAEIIKQGYGHAYTKYPFKQEYMDLFIVLEKEARESGRGLWANTKQKENKIEPYWLNTKSNTLHNSDCRWYGSTSEGYYTITPTGKDCGICGGAHREKVLIKEKESPENDLIVYVTRTGTKYHMAGCRYLKKSAIPMKLSEAKKRYSPCSVCNPPH